MSEGNDESDQEASLALYKEQLSQVNQATQLSGETTDLLQLRNDLKELIALTEENLLQLKKARLLKSLEESSLSLEPEDKEQDQYEDEYAAFQASVSALSSSVETTPAPSQSLSVCPSHHRSSEPRSLTAIHGSNSKLDGSTVKDNDADSRSSSSDDDDDYDDNDDSDSSLTHMIGTKCQAPIKNDWGGHHYGNAMIWSVEAPSESTHSSEYMVTVIFLNPTQPSMVSCSYYMNGSCRFSSQTCRRSHGQAVLVSELKPYVEPDYSKICEGCRCLARWEDEVWYPGTVVDVCDDHQVNVKFDAAGTEATVLVEHLMPISQDEDAADDNSDGSEGEDNRTSTTTSQDRHKLDKRDDDDDDDYGLPVYLWKPLGTTDRLGAWEAHTKGVGSRLMAKMGYITGQGLGKNRDGRAEPVPIMLLPQGKSLDKIMELKEMAGNADLFNAMKSMEKRQKILEKKEAEKEKRREERTNRGVFGFLNKKLHDHTGEQKSGSGHTHRSNHAHSSKHKRAEATTVTSTRELGKRSDKDVNLQIFKTAEEIRGVERNLSHLRKQLARNESRDRKMADQVKQKIEEQESYLRQLKTSSQTLETHKQSRSAHKKLTIF